MALAAVRQSDEGHAWDGMSHALEVFDPLPSTSESTEVDRDLSPAGPVFKARYLWSAALVNTLNWDFIQRSIFWLSFTEWWTFTGTWAHWGMQISTDLFAKEEIWKWIFACEVAQRHLARLPRFKAQFCVLVFWKSFSLNSFQLLWVVVIASMPLEKEQVTAATAGFGCDKNDATGI